MQYRKLGETGLQVSSISFGSYLTFGHSVDLQIATKLMQIAYDAGVNMFDNAEIYAQGRAEKIMGSVMKELEWPRDTYILMTKVFWGGPKPTQIGLHRKHIYDCCNTSLKHFNTEYIDLFLCHRPDFKTSIEETVETMHHLIQQGKILYWGTSEWSILEIQEAMLIAKQRNLTPPKLEQFQYNMLERHKAEKEFECLFLQKNLGATITMPLAGGLLTGRYNDGIPEGSRYSRFPSIKNFLSPERWELAIKKVKELSNVANSINMSMAQLAISWCLKNSNISSVIVGCSNEKDLNENLKSISLIDDLTHDVMNDINNILENTPSRCQNMDYDIYDYNKMLEGV